tara:strand:- start:52820 stop:53515 length:696 start_codon:yes stop_codon:yes gene_type:complete
MYKTICIIPARSGSTRIKNKNIKFFFGKPIIYWVIKAAKESKCFSKILVSSNDNRILNIAKKYGASTLKRNKKLSNNYVSIHDVIQNVILQLRNRKEEYKYVCYLFPTAALIKGKDIVNSFHLIKKKRGKFVITVTNYQTPINHSLKINKKGTVIMRYPKKFLKRTQDLENNYHDAGHIYWATIKDLLKYKNTTNKALGYFLDNMRVQDINDHVDWKLAEMKFKLLRKKQK